MDNDAESRHDEPPVPPTVRRRRRDPVVTSLAAFARALESQSVPQRRAAILWLADKFLGVNLRPWV